MVKSADIENARTHVGFHACILDQLTAFGWEYVYNGISSTSWKSSKNSQFWSIASVFQNGLLYVLFFYLLLRRKTLGEASKTDKISNTLGWYHVRIVH